MKPVFVRNPYNYDVDKASDESGLKCKDKSLAKQEFADEVNINTIIKRFGLDGELPQGVRMPTYGDFTGLGDFQDAMNAVAQANEAFMSMPARVRERFDNDPQKFVEFCSDAKNADEAAELGLVSAEAFDRLEAARKARELAAAEELVAASRPPQEGPVKAQEKPATAGGGTGST